MSRVIEGITIGTRFVFENKTYGLAVPIGPRSLDDAYFDTCNQVILDDDGLRLAIKRLKWLQKTKRIDMETLKNGAFKHETTKLD